MDQLVNLIVQACKNDFYFSHRIFFQLRSVTFESLNDVIKEEQQRQAVDTVLKNIYEMILASIESREHHDGEYVERLFLPNSRDFVRLLVSFNLVQYHPQLMKCHYTEAML